MEARGVATLECLLGLAVGDALGAFWEGTSIDLIEIDKDSMEILMGLDSWRWTDDTQMALSIVSILGEHGTIRQDALAGAFSARYQSGRGYGSGMHFLMQELRLGKNWRNLSPKLFGTGSYGNGSAMRVPPLGAFFKDATPEQVIREASASAEVTHFHHEAREGAKAVALGAWLAARSSGTEGLSFQDYLNSILGLMPDDSEVRAGIQKALSLGPAAPLNKAVEMLGNGSRVTCQDTVPLVLWIAACNQDDFKGGVLKAIRAGGDTDTNAAVVGGIIAARVGIDGIPQDWLAKLEPLPNVWGRPRKEGCVQS